MKHSLRILITAGPTHEPIDSVRYLANRSSGRMGVALAQAASKRGWAVTLLLGPASIAVPESSQNRILRFQTTTDLQALLQTQWQSHDVLFMAAAVADYRPKRSNDQKIRRMDRSMTLELEPTPDVLGELAASSRPDQTLVGFALEPADRLIDSARSKAERKGVHAIVANPLETMDSPNITATLILRNGEVLPGPVNVTKAAFAEWLLDQLPLIRRSQ